MSGSEVSAFWVAAPGRGELRLERLRAVQPGEVLVRTLFSGVSRGTESLVFRGEVPPGEYARMRAPFQDGEFPGPVKYGYANVGVVEQGPEPLKGKTVFCLYPHQTRYIVPATAVHVVPDAIPAGRVVLAANLETALNGLWDATLQPGDRVAVIGAGVVGSLVAWLARDAGHDVVLIDINPRREALAKALGVAFSVPAAAAANRAQQVDKIIHASGAPAGLLLALELAAFEATVIEMSWYGNKLVSLPLGEAFHALRLTLKSSQVGSIAPSHRATWSYERRLAHVLGLLGDERLDVLINSESRFSDLPAVMPRLVAAGGDVLCHRVNY
ncbi:MAG: zinc-binding alcohol dehydrogenase [Steroidobacteraceae bacterium]